MTHWQCDEGTCVCVLHARATTIHNCSTQTTTTAIHITLYIELKSSAIIRTKDKKLPEKLKPILITSYGQEWISTVLHSATSQKKYTLYRSHHYIKQVSPCAIGTNHSFCEAKNSNQLVFCSIKTCTENVTANLPSPATTQLHTKQILPKSYNATRANTTHTQQHYGMQKWPSI